ncbi:MAG: hypothetical protein COB36_01865 [Alphaproteobacteria bacterium]|nr:MAG: hypothetical protein COB36_01865 [Alphaproteobacteria bacterium]
MVFKIDHTQPIELSEFSESLTAIADQFQKHIIDESFSINEDEIRLYICEIEKGSIIAKIKALPRHYHSFDIDSKKIINSFTNKTKEAIDYFLSRVDLKPELNIQELNNYKKILQPAASDKGTALSFIAEEGSTQTINLTINHIEANAAQNRIDHEIGLQKMPNNLIETNVLFYCYQARNDRKSKTGDMGIIETISQSPVKTVPASDNIKDTILKNPFDRAYIVNVEVHTVNGKPKMYKILEIHDSIDIT